MRYTFADCELDTQLYTLWRAGQPLPLRPKVFQVLRYLIEHRHRVVSKQELLAHVWPEHFISDATLENCIKEVRQVIGDSGRAQRLIHTLRGHGYRFAAAIASGDRAQPDREPSSAALPEPLLAPETAERLSRPEGAGSPLAPRLPAVHHGGPGRGGVSPARRPCVDRGVEARLRALLRLLHQRLRTPALGEGLAVRMGIDSGPVVMGQLGSATPGHVTAVGPPTQGALRLQQQAAPGTLLVSAATYHLVQEEVQGEPCGCLALDARQAPLPVYAVQGLAQRCAGVPQRAPQARSPFVGRQQELALLHNRLAAVRAGAGQVVSLVGPPGMGKTRRLTEFGHRLAPDRVT
jgi:DNA-binding winged helix-turn-helix (wHTH) protein